MIASAGIPWVVSRRRIGRRHLVRPVHVTQDPPGLWARFWSDRQAVRLKIILLAVCLLAAALLEAPW